MMRLHKPLAWPLMLLAILAAVAQAGVETADPGRPKIGLVLAGGGARGLAHIGVIRYLEEQHIRIDAVAGTSMGGVIGALYASGLNADQIEVVARNLDWALAFNDETPRDQLSFRQKQEDFDYLVDAKFRFRGGRFRLAGGIIEGQNLNLILHDLVRHVAHVHDFDKLPIPYRAVAADIATGEPVVLSKGDLAVAMRATMSIPGIFTPVDLDGKLLVDGGIANNVPVDVVQGMGVDHVIVIDIGSPLASREQLENVLSIVGQLTTILTRKNSERQIARMRSGDVLIQPALDEAGVETMSFDKAERAIEAGYQGAVAMSSQLAVLSRPGAPPTLIATVDPDAPMPVIDRIEVETDSEVPEELLRNMVRQRPGERLDMSILESDIASIYGLDAFSRVDYAISESAEERVLTVRAKANPLGTSYMKVGMSWDQDSHGESEFGLAASWRQKGLNRRGLEWYTAAQLGGSSYFRTQLYQPLDVLQRYFVEVSYRFNERNINLSEDTRAIARFQQSEHGVHFASGLNISNTARLSAGLFAKSGEADLKIGDPSLSSSSNDDLGFALELRYDTLDRPHFPGRGQRMLSRYEQGMEDWGADAGYEAFSISGTTSHSFGKTIASVYGNWSQVDLDDEAESAFLASQFYALGGFLQLSGYTRYSLVGNYRALLGATVYRRLNEQSILPFDVPVYVGASLESGNIWLKSDDVAADDLIYAGSLYVGADTPLGPLYLSVGVAENDQQAVYLTLGQVFD
jgi:NTE family protein